MIDLVVKGMFIDFSQLCVGYRLAYFDITYIVLCQKKKSLKQLFIAEVYNNNLKGITNSQTKQLNFYVRIV